MANGRLKDTKLKDLKFKSKTRQPVIKLKVEYAGKNIFIT